MSFDIELGYVSRAGKKEVNEDFVAAMLPGPGQEAMGVIAAIADGVSRGGAGREAAQTTVVSLVRDYFGVPETWDTTVALDRIISAQNTWLAAVNRRRQPALGLTTLTALVLRGQSYTLAHVGDTRAYLLRDGDLRQLSVDHVVAHRDFMHQLTRCVGADERLVVDYSQGELQCGDVFVLLSDGVHGVLGETQLRRMLGDGLAGGNSVQALSEALVQGAAAKGGRDDATALVLRLSGAIEATLHNENRQAWALPAPARLKVGDVLDGLVVTALVADNGIHLLYQVREPRSRRLYVLKALNPKRARDPEECATLAHEAWLAKRMQSGRAGEHLMHLQTVPPAGGTPSAFYLVYDWHSGETLQQMLDRKHRFTAQQSAELVRQVAHALGRMHRQGVIHRDIKPANLHRGDDGVVRVLDLGVALSGREPPATRALHAGTPSYINPEQWGFGTAARGEAPPEPPDAQSDLFALGVTLYQLLAGGRLPYGQVVPYQAGRYRRDPVAPSRHDPQVPIWLDHVALKAVALDKRQRFETAEEFLLALERGASRALPAPPASPLLQRDRTALWKIGLAVSVLLNLLLVYWLLFLPR